VSLIAVSTFAGMRQFVSYQGQSGLATNGLNRSKIPIVTLNNREPCRRALLSRKFASGIGTQSIPLAVINRPDWAFRDSAKRMVRPCSCPASDSV
jgi:hypothetical protein